MLASQTSAFGALLWLCLALVCMRVHALRATMGYLLPWHGAHPLGPIASGAVQMAHERIIEAQLLPSVELEWLWHDSGCCADDSVLAVQQLATCELDVVIGGACSSTIPSLQGLAAFYGIPAIALQARSSSFEDRSAFPNLSRMTPPIDQMVTPMLHLIQQFDWSGFAILASNKYHYARTANLLADAAERLDLDVAYKQQFQAMEDTQNSSNIAKHVSRIVDSGARVVFLLGDCPDVREYIRAAIEQNAIIGFAFIVIDMHARCHDHEFGFTNLGDDKAIEEAMSGVWSLEFGPPSARQQYDPDPVLGFQTVREFSQTSAARIGDFLTSYIPPPAGNAACTPAKPKQMPEYSSLAYFVPNDNGFAGLLYDASMTFAFALNASLAHFDNDTLQSAGHVRDLVNHTTLMDAMAQVRFNGVSGGVQFDSSGGRILSPSTSFTVVLKSVTSAAAPTLEIDRLAIWTGSAWQFLVASTSITWPGGMQSIPVNDPWDGDGGDPEPLLCKSGIYSIMIFIILGVETTLLTFLAVKNKGFWFASGPASSVGDSCYTHEEPVTLGFPLADQSRETARVVAEMQRGDPYEVTLLSQVLVKPSAVKLGEVVGIGSFAEVRQATLNGRLVAAKILRTANARSIQRFKMEILLHKDLTHPCLTKFVGASWLDGRLIMLEEFMPGGTLADFLSKPPFALTWEHCLLKIATDIAKGMSYLHGSRYYDVSTRSYQPCIIHRDLKPQNILITKTYGAKITDFGEARVARENDSMSQVGTMLYAAPEVTQGTRYDEKCDVYSFSMVLVALIEQTADLFELFATAFRQSEQFEADEEDEVTSDASGARMSRSRSTRITMHMLTNAIINHHLRPQLRTTVVESLRLLTLNCWDEESARRPSFNEIYTFLVEVVKDEVGEKKQSKPGTGLRRIPRLAEIPVELGVPQPPHVTNFSEPATAISAMHEQATDRDGAAAITLDVQDCKI